MISLGECLSDPGCSLLSSAPEGFDALLLGEAVAGTPGRALLHVASDDARMSRLAGALRFFHPDVQCLLLPAWDCLPYDRVSPNPALVGQRMETLTRLAAPESPPPAGRVVLTTVNAFLQRVPARDSLADSRRTLESGGELDLDDLIAFLEDNGYARTGTVMEPGEYAPRGGLLDVFPSAAEAPLRIDLFGDRIESVRVFDPMTQRSGAAIDGFVLGPMSELRLDADSIARFRAGYRELFGAMTAGDPLYEAASAGQRHIGMEHWLALFHERLDTVADYLPDAPVSLDPLAGEARDARLAAIADYYAARCEATAGGADIESIYRPVPPERLYLDAAEWDRLLAPRAVLQFTPFRAPETAGRRVFDAGGKPARNFAAERADPGVNLFDAVRDYLADERAAGRRVIFACFSPGSCDRLSRVLDDHGVEGVVRAGDWRSACGMAPDAVAVVILDLDHGFETEDLVILSEQDVLGDRIARPPRRARRSDAFIAEASSLAVGDLVVHADHGVGRFDGLETLSLGDAPHDCLRLIYAGDDKLYLPVENIELLSRYGAADAPVQLDRLGGTHWQARKARLKQRIREMAGELVRIAAARRVRAAESLTPPEGLYEEFGARFPYGETEDQRRAILDVIDDLARGRPMDRLICGDVGFGKTEVALRAAFIAVMAGKQVAVVVPTTLLARQHFQTFSERFAGLPVGVEQLSRLVAAKRAGKVKEGLATGRVDIVIGTHALLGKSIRFRDLGLLVIDEEQHFGVAHKERLKQMRSDVHVLTLTATPIPRTLQMALSGVRELSLIATPPVDRLAVRTFIMPYDPVVVREAILREHLRGGQVFYVCPRIEDVGRLAERLRALVPEVKIVTAHGRMAASQLEKTMNAFYNGSYDVLISTAIIESGLDIPNVNTMIVHRAQMFGLAQLYQLRGRIGRAKVRAYAYFTLPAHGGLSLAAIKRLEVMHKLDSLGAGFTLASHDLDIRGAGNLLGAEQSGHIREVGLELYQQMLDQAVGELRAAEEGAPAEAREEWSPQISLGTAVLIPADYVADLGVRLALYRRLAGLDDQAEIDAFAAELVDRFGPLPQAVENLLRIVAIKRLCRAAGIDRLEVGAEGAVVSFHGNRFADPGGLVAFINRQGDGVRLRPDHRLVIKRDWGDVDARLAGTSEVVADLAELVRAAA
ncbi:MAG: transcription-repair coupling factor [Alphaproteobacteria bacterium]